MIIIRVPTVIFLPLTRHFLIPTLLPQPQSDFQHLVVRDVLHVVLADRAARGLHVSHEDLVQLASLLVRLRALLEDFMNDLTAEILISIEVSDLCSVR